VPTRPLPLLSDQAVKIAGVMVQSVVVETARAESVRNTAIAVQLGSMVRWGAGGRCDQSYGCVNQRRTVGHCWVTARGLMRYICTRERGYAVTVICGAECWLSAVGRRGLGPCLGAEVGRRW